MEYFVTVLLLVAAIGFLAVVDGGVRRNLTESVTGLLAPLLVLVLLLFLPTVTRTAIEIAVMVFLFSLLLFGYGTIANEGWKKYIGPHHPFN